MLADTGLTGYDLVIIVLFALLVIRGIWLGFLKQITGLLALYLGYIVAGQYHDRVSPFLKEISQNPKVVFFASWVILFIAAYVAVMLVGKMLAYVMKLTVTGWFDKLLGGLLGAAKALLLIVIIHMALRIVLPPENKMLTTCRTCNALTKTTNFTLSLIRDDDVRKILSQQTMPISSKDVKEFFDTPPKEKSSSENPAPAKAPAGQAPAEKSVSEKPAAAK